MHMVYMISYGAKTMVFVVKMNNLTSINEMVHIQDLPITMGRYEVLIKWCASFQWSFARGRSYLLTLDLSAKMTMISRHTSLNIFELMISIQM